MSHQFKSGDPALIIGAKYAHQNIGKACELVEMVVDGQEYRAPDGDLYLHEGIASWVVVGGALVVMVDDQPKPYGWALCRPAHLLPLSRSFIPVEQKCQAEPL